MHSPRAFVAAVVLLGAIGCGSAATSADPTETLRATRQAAAEAIAAGDVERLFSFWADDMVIFPVSEPAVHGIDEVRAYVRRNRQERGLAPRTTPLDIVAAESGDLGYILGTHVWVDRDGHASMPGRYVTLWRKNGEGEWKAFLEIHSPAPEESQEEPPRP